MKSKVNAHIKARWDSLINLSLKPYLHLTRRELAKTLQIPSHITPRERLLLNDLAKGRRVIVEIGSYIGASAAAFATADRDPEGKIYCIDTWQNDAMSEGTRSTEDEFRSNLGPLIGRVVMMKGYSQHQFSKLAGVERRIDLLFIDGDHGYDGVRTDWSLYSRLLGPGSVVIFHDFGWAPGVKKVVQQAAAAGLTVGGTLPNLWWGYVK